jgi:hypothetical protein
MPAGSAVVYLGSAIHAGGRNSTADSWRRGMHMSFVVGWLRTEDNNYLGTPPDVARTLPRRSQELLGYAAHDAIADVRREIRVSTEERRHVVRRRGPGPLFAGTTSEPATGNHVHRRVRILEFIASEASRPVADRRESTVAARQTVADGIGRERGLIDARGHDVIRVDERPRAQVEIADANASSPSQPADRLSP